jgi:hypothetical protein
MALCAKVRQIKIQPTICMAADEPLLRMPTTLQFMKADHNSKTYPT